MLLPEAELANHAQTNTNHFKFIFRRNFPFSVRIRIDLIYCGAIKSLSIPLCCCCCALIAAVLRVVLCCCCCCGRLLCILCCSASAGAAAVVRSRLLRASILDLFGGKLHTIQYNTLPCFAIHSVFFRIVS